MFLSGWSAEGLPEPAEVAVVDPVVLTVLPSAVSPVPAFPAPVAPAVREVLAVPVAQVPAVPVFLEVGVPSEAEVHPVAGNRSTAKRDQTKSSRLPSDEKS